MPGYYSSFKSQYYNHNHDGHSSSLSVQNAFLAGAVSASLLWSLTSWSMKQSRSNKKYNGHWDQKHDNSQQEEEEDIDSGAEEDASRTSYNPWKTKQAVQYRQLLELRESLIEHSRRTSLLLLDKILHQSRQFLGESHGEKKRLRWPWESLRRHLSKKNLFLAMTSGDKLSRLRYDDTIHHHETGDEYRSHGKSRTGNLQSPSSFSSVAAASASLAEDMNHLEMEEEKEICIGSIFGLDVGGTLSKLVYFEKKRNVSITPTTTISQSPTTCGKSQSARIIFGYDPKWDTLICHHRQNPLHRHHSPDVGEKEEENGCVLRGHNRTVSEFSHFHESCSEDDLQRTTYPIHLPYASSSSMQDSNVMKRSHSLFDLTSKKAKREKALDRFYEFARRLDTYDTEFKDKNLSFYSRALGGEVHFVQFETRFLQQAMDLIRINDLHLNISKMGATGGGAHKYADKWEQLLGIEIVRQDESDSLVAGMQFILSDVVGECYTFVPNNTQSEMKKKNHNRHGDYEQLPKQTQPFRCDDNGKHQKAVECDVTSDGNVVDDKINKENKNLDQYWWSRKVKRDLVATSDSYPYLLVMIGTGVSVLRVDGPRKHERISGSTIGGGTYWGLCRLLTDVEDFESVLNLAEKGDPSKVDM
jgi:Pantothenate kinase, acetyl-CoA regulated